MYNTCTTYSQLDTLYSYLYETIVRVTLTGTCVSALVLVLVQLFRLVIPPDERAGEQAGAGATQAARRVPRERADGAERAAEPAPVHGERPRPRGHRLHLEDAPLLPRGRRAARRPPAQDALHEPQSGLHRAAGAKLSRHTRTSTL